MHAVRSQQSEFTVALGISLAAHALILAALFSGGIARWFSQRDLKAEPEPEVVAIISPELFLKPVSAPEPEPEAELPPAETPPKFQPPRQYVRTTGKEGEATAKSDSPFISDRNTHAASSNPESNPDAPPVPTMEGKQLPGLEMVDRASRPGELAEDMPRPAETPPTEPTPASPADSRPAEPAPQTAENTAEPPPETPAAAAMVESVPKEPPAPKAPETLSIADSVPEPENLLVPDQASEIRKRAEKMRQDTADLLAQTMIRAPRLDPVEFQPALPAQKPVNPIDPVFVPETARRETTGSVSNEGPAAVDAKETAIGRYMRAVTGAVEKQWAEARLKHGDILNYSRLRVKFFVRADGTPERLQIIEDNAGAGIVDFTLGAILEADIPPMPKEVAEELSGDPLEINYDVIIY